MFMGNASKVEGNECNEETSNVLELYTYYNRKKFSGYKITAN